jgi:hypothetical protein
MLPSTSRKELLEERTQRPDRRAEEGKEGEPGEVDKLSAFRPSALGALLLSFREGAEEMRLAGREGASAPMAGMQPRQEV